jgi:hypothetical protein
MSANCFFLFVHRKAELDWVTAFAQKKEQEEKLGQAKVRIILFKINGLFTYCHTVGLWGTTGQ